MYSPTLLLGITSLILASTAHAQAERALMNLTPTAYGITRTSGPGATADTSGASVPRVAGERALLGTVENRVSTAEPPRATDAPIDGARGLLGRPSSPISTALQSTSDRFRFFGTIRGEVSADVSGPAEFGMVQSGDDYPAAFVVSLGGRGEHSAIMFTHRSGSTLGVGRYRVSDGGDGSDEILALVVTGSPTDPTGVFRGRSGWLVVTAVSDQHLAGRFELDAIGFRAAEPEREDRAVNVSGTFSARVAGLPSQAAS